MKRDEELTVSVKSLEWLGPRISEDGDDAFDAYSAVGHYIATAKGWFIIGQTGWNLSENAKAAAQADYEARIRSALLSIPKPGATHSDDEAVDRFAAAMKAKLAKKRDEGRGGWEDKSQCSNEFLTMLLRDHVEKGDPVDVSNLAMMIHQRSERIAKPEATEGGAHEKDASGVYIDALAEEKTRLAGELSHLRRSAAMLDVARERSRQVDAEGWSESHDDAHHNGEIAGAASCYVLHDLSFKIPNTQLGHKAAVMARELWPWDAAWWKPSDRRRNLVKATALLVAEIERLDRAALTANPEQTEHVDTDVLEKSASLNTSKTDWREG